MRDASTPGPSLKSEELSIKPTEDSHYSSPSVFNGQTVLDAEIMRVLAIISQGGLVSSQAGG